MPMVMTEGLATTAPGCKWLLNGIRVPRPGSRGGPQHPVHPLGDEGDWNPTYWQLLRRRGIAYIIPHGPISRPAVGPPTRL